MKTLIARRVSAIQSPAFRAVLGLMSVLGIGASAHAVEKTWDGGAGTANWHDAANWSPDGVPAAADDVVIGAGPAEVLYTSTTGDRTVATLSCSTVLRITGGTLQGPGYPIETADIEFATFDFFQSAQEGLLLRLWVRAPEGLAPGSHHFIAAVPDLFTEGFVPVPVTTGTNLRVEIVSPKAARQGDVNGDGAVNSSDLASLLVSWGVSNPVGRADGDLDGDGDVDGSDLAVLLATWG
jgi:hypothetical protein